MTEAIGNEKNNYTFSRKDGLFLNFDVISHLVIYWPLMGLGPYMVISHPNVYTILLCILMCLLLLFSCVCLHNRWLLFKYEEDTTLSIDIEQRDIIYKHNDRAIGFSLNDIVEWYWNEYKIDLYGTYAEIIEIRLKNGEKIIVSNGIGPILYFFLDNWKELGMPEDQENFTFDELCTIISDRLEEARERESDELSY